MWSAMDASTFNCTVRLVGLATAIFDAVIPGAVTTCVVPCKKFVLTPVSVTVTVWPGDPEFGETLETYGDTTRNS